MRWWDVELLLPVERELFGASAWSAETFWSELAQPATRCYLVAGDGTQQVLGYAGLMAIGAQADVQTIAVAGAAQGRGIGARLLQALIDEGLRRGAGALMLEVRADNAPAIRLYRRFGFVQLAIRRGYYQPGNADAVVMRRRPLRAATSAEG